MPQKVFTGFVIASFFVYIYVLYYMLFRLLGRQMVIMPEGMLDNYNYWNSVNLVPFKTITQYITAAVGGSIRGHAIRNLGGNLLLMFAPRAMGNISSPLRSDFTHPRLTCILHWLTHLLTQFAYLCPGRTILYSPFAIL
jgi:hypothetical protein